jgi:hypothetical protein
MGAVVIVNVTSLKGASRQLMVEEKVVRKTEPVSVGVTGAFA